MGVMTLVAPGPDVTITTPGFPEARAYPMIYISINLVQPSKSYLVPCGRRLVRVEVR
jgi:hypothetical protein